MIGDCGDVRDSAIATTKRAPASGLNAAHRRKFRAHRLHLSPRRTNESLKRALLLFRSDLIIGTLIALATWPYSVAMITPSTAPAGFVADFYMALEQRLHYGTQVIYTYGPLGFLATPSVYYRGPAIAAIAITLALYLAVATTIFGSLRKRMNVWLAAVIGYFVTGAAIDFTYPQDEAELGLGIAVAISLLLISTNGWPRRPRLTWMALGFLASLLSLMKISTGVAAGCLLLIALVSCARQRSHVLLSLGAAALTWLAGWFGTGNDFGNVPTYVKAAYAESVGYSQAMQLEVPGKLSHYWLAGLAFALTLTYIFGVSIKYPLPRRIAAVLSVFIAEWFLFREGFVRHDIHDVIFVSATILVTAGIGVVQSARRRYILPTTFLFLSAILYLFHGSAPFSRSQPISSLSNLEDVVRTVASAANSERIESVARSAMHRSFSIPDSMLRRIGNKPVSVEPFDNGALWAYPQLDFDPEPTIQNYNAYTSSLDSTDVNWLRGNRSPTFILYQSNSSIDGRDPAFDPPAMELTIACNYRQIAASPTWQLLSHTSDRCNSPHLLKQVRSGFNDVVRVPSAPQGEAVVASFALSVPISWVVEDLLFKPEEITLYTNGRLAYRFISGTAADLHLLVPPSNLDFTGSFASVPVSSLEFSVLGAGTLTPIKIRFYSVRF